MTELPPAGWYRDPDGGAEVEKWWDGSSWTAFARTAGATSLASAPIAVPTAYRPANTGYAPRPAQSVPRKGLGCFGGSIVALLVIVLVATVANVIGSMGEETSTSRGEEVSQEATERAPLRVLYEVEGTASSVSLTHSTPSGTEQHDSRLPVTNT
jgi:hypothetical protein